MDFEQSERFGAAPKLGLGGGRLCGRGTAGIVFSPHVLCEMTLGSCPVCTCLACVWFDARVRPHVPCEMTLSSCPVDYVHFLHAYGLMPVCVRMCFVRALF